MSLGIANCTTGETYQEPSEYGVFRFTSAFLYREFHQTYFTPLWKSCDFGYTPTPCDEAVFDLERSRWGPSITQYFPDHLTPACLINRGLGLLPPTDVCPANCSALLNAVYTQCDAPTTTTVVISEYTEGKGTTVLVKEWEYPESLAALNLDGSNFDTDGSIPVVCFNEYASMQSSGEREKPTGSFVYFYAFMGVRLVLQALMF